MAMTPNRTSEARSRRQERAALLVAADELTDEQIAARIGVTKGTLERWKRDPAFRERVREHRRLWRDEITREGIADRMARVAALNDRWQRLQRVIAARAVEHAAVPGGDTGLLVRTVSLVKVYRASPREDGSEALAPSPATVLVTEYAVDTGLLRELREHEKQAAQELGQWSEKHELSATEQFLAALMEYGRGARAE